MNTERLKGWLSSSSKLVAASAQLAKKQAELATLNKVTLPKLYHAIGKRIIDAKNLPSELVPHREKIRELEAAIATKLEEPKSEPASGFAAKAKQLAQQAAAKTAKATADAAAGIRIQTAYTSLGKQVVEEYAAAIPEDLAQRLADAVRQQQDLGSAISAISTPHAGRVFTPKRFVLATLGCAGVLVGLLFMTNKGVRSDRTTPDSAAAARSQDTKKSGKTYDPMSEEEIQRRSEARRAKRAETWGNYASTPEPSSSRDKVSIQDFYELPRNAKMSQVVAAVGEPSKKVMPVERQELIEWHYFDVPARYGTDYVTLYFDKFTERLSMIRDASGVQSR
jgi:hypothetical protein